MTLHCIKCGNPDDWWCDDDCKCNCHDGPPCSDCGKPSDTEIEISSGTSKEILHFCEDCTVKIMKALGEE